MKTARVAFFASVIAACPAVAQQHGSALSGPHPAAAGAPVEGEPLVDNDLVEVLHLHLGPHEKTPMHDVTPRVVVWLSDAHFVDTYADGTKREEFRKAGDAEFVSARRHAGENLSDQSMEFMGVIVKSAARAERH
jgi:hypothetical protein